MNEKIRRYLIITCVAVLLALLGMLMYYGIVASAKKKTYTGGVKDIDFSNYENKELTNNYINSGYYRFYVNRRCRLSEEYLFQLERISQIARNINGKSK